MFVIYDKKKTGLDISAVDDFVISVYAPCENGGEFSRYGFECRQIVS